MEKSEFGGSHLSDHETKSLWLTLSLAHKTDSSMSTVSLYQSLLFFFFEMYTNHSYEPFVWERVTIDSP